MYWDYRGKLTIMKSIQGHCFKPAMIIPKCHSSSRIREHRRSRQHEWSWLSFSLPWTTAFSFCMWNYYLCWCLPSCTHVFIYLLFDQSSYIFVIYLFSLRQLLCGGLISRMLGELPSKEFIWICVCWGQTSWESHKIILHVIVVWNRLSLRQVFVSFCKDKPHLIKMTITMVLEG